MLIDSDLNETIITPFINHKEKTNITMSYGVDPVGYTVRYKGLWHIIYPQEDICPEIIEKINVPEHYKIKKFIKSSYIRKGIVLTEQNTIKNLSQDTQQIFPNEGMFQIQFIHDDDSFELDKLLTLDKCSIVSKHLPPKYSCLVSTLETIENASDEVLHIIPYIANQDIKIYVAAIDPGYIGQLTFLIQNVSNNHIVLKDGMIIGQLTKHKLTKNVSTLYNSKYQFSKGIVRE